MNLQKFQKKSFVLFCREDQTQHQHQDLVSSWFVQVLNKYRKSLALVFYASLMSQLFDYWLPLLLQQIIDKVLAQGNLSSEYT